MRERWSAGRRRVLVVAAGVAVGAGVYEAVNNTDNEVPTTPAALTQEIGASLTINPGLQELTEAMVHAQSGAERQENIRAQYAAMKIAQLVERDR